MKTLNGKRVLFIAPKFFGYELEIQQEIERRGAIVDFLPDRPFDDPLKTAITRFSPQLIQPFINRLYHKQLNLFGSSNYDIILTINGQTITPQFLSMLKMSFPQAKFVLYMWDSMNNRPRIAKNLHFYDDVYCFDPESAKNFGMKIRPTFFTPGFQSPIKLSYDYQLSFIGTMHSDRYEIINKIRAKVPKNIKSYWHLYLQAPWVFKAYKVMKPAMRNAPIENFKFKPLEKLKVQQIFSNSKAIIDIEHPKQHGLTMRAFEAMGSNKKLITTNHNIKTYDFFREENICVVDRKDPNISLDFLETQYFPTSAELYYKYSLAGWLDEVLSLNG